MPPIQTRSRYLSIFAFAALSLAALACHLPGAGWWVDVDESGDIVVDTDPDHPDPIREEESGDGNVSGEATGSDEDTSGESESGGGNASSEATGGGEQTGDETAEEDQTTIIVQINLNSTSDWTTLGVASGGSYASVELLSSSGAIGYAELSDGALLLSQHLDLARAGEIVDAVFRVEFTGIDPDGVIRFDLNKGDYGTSRATFYSESQGGTSLINEFVQPGKTDHPQNQMAFELPVQAFIAHRTLRSRQSLMQSST